MADASWGVLGRVGEEVVQHLDDAPPGLGRLHCRVRELWSRRPLSRTFTSRTLNGLSALCPSPMFVAATVRLLLGRVALRWITDIKSLQRPRHIQIAAVPFPKAKIRGGGWQSGDRSASSGLDGFGF